MSNTLETIDALCEVSRQLVSIVRGQAVLIEQAKAAGVIFSDDFLAARKQTEETIKRIGIMR